MFIASKYECDELMTCEKGFYVPSNDGANVAKAQALYLRKHGKKEFLRFMTDFIRNMIFQKHKKFWDRMFWKGIECWKRVKKDLFN